MKKLTLLLAAGALWLFLAAIPAFADGGPHVAAMNSGTSTLTADSCAGCHRAHTAQGEYLINKTSEEALCLGCHGTAVAGATTSVMDGVQYALGTDGLRDETAVWTGALRGGGFDQAHIGQVGRLNIGSERYASKVTVASTGRDVTSAHIAMADNGLTNPNKLWGNGAVNSASPTVSLSCADCHNPHGNGQYRILNPVPAPTGATAMSGNPVNVNAVDANTDQIYTKQGHPFLQGDFITIAGTGTGVDGNWVVWGTSNGITLQISPLYSSASPATTGISAAAPRDIPAGTYTQGTIVRTSAPIKDAPLGTLTGSTYPLKNYTVIQTQGTQAASYAAPTWGGFTFFAGQVTSANTTGDYWHRYVPWNNRNGNQDSPNGMPLTVAPDNQVAFNQQMTAWCSSCHTRYYARQNQNPGGQQGSSTFADRAVASVAGDTITISTTLPAGGTITSTGFSLGDVVDLSGMAPAVNDGYVVSVSGMTMKVSAAIGGTPITFTASGGTAARVAPATASGWFFPRTDAAGTPDATFKYQHSTQSNRTCNVCHVAHGSNRVMTGTFSADVSLPGGAAAQTITVVDPDTGTGSVVSADSRLLKVDNRGTCQGCHDPTATTGVSGWAFSTPTGAYQGAPSGITGGTWSTATPPVNTGGGVPVLP